MERRHTIQKDLVLGAVRSLKSHVTAEDVYNYIIKDHPSVGKGTVYRNLNILAEEGEIRKVEVPGGPERFDFTLREHYHIKCKRCGSVTDVDMDAIPDMMDKIHNMNGMKFLSYDIVFQGLCQACQE